jgi:hypothetical protein
MTSAVLSSNCAGANCCGLLTLTLGCCKIGAPPAGLNSTTTAQDTFQLSFLTALQYVEHHASWTLPLSLSAFDISDQQYEYVFI